jgi:hypothetical protein
MSLPVPARFSLRDFKSFFGSADGEAESMNRLLTVLKWLIVVAAVLFVGIQLIQPAKTNPIVDQSFAIENQTKLEPAVAVILDRSCFDCHSNRTTWPWYSNIAPVSWFVVNHVNGGRQDLNFSTWGKYDEGRRRDQLKQMCEEVKGGSMPIGSYTLLHANSRLTHDDVKVLCDWTERERRK